MASCRFAERMDNKFIQDAEIVRALFRAGQDQRKNLVFIGRIHQDTQQVKQFFSGTHTTREDDYPVRDTHERLKTFFDIRHDNQFINQRIRWFSGNNRRLGHTNESAFFITLLRVANRRAFHWGFHRAWAAAGTNIQFAQSQLCANPAGVQIFSFINGVAAPADDHVRRFAHVQSTGVT
ncbi:hypothetical protein D3C80_1488130 [compost metagenome]